MSPRPNTSAAPGCRATNRRGEPCGMPPTGGIGLCFAHDPTQAAARAIARKRGGRERARGSAATREAVSLRSADDVRQLIERAVADTLALENSALRNRTVGALVGVALRTIEVGELEARLAAMEARLAAAGGTAPRLLA